MCCHKFRLSILLIPLILIASGCIQAEQRRQVKPQVQEQVNFERYLTELEKAATVLTILQSVIAIPGVFDQLPVSFASSLKQTSNTIRYLSSPRIEADGDNIKLSAAKMNSLANQSESPKILHRDSVQLSAWFFLGETRDLPRMNRLMFSYLAGENRVDSVVLEKTENGNNRINFEEIVALFPAEKGSPEEPNFLSGLMLYDSNSPGLLNITGNDLVFALKDANLHLTFTFSVNERNGSVVAGTISGKIIDPKTKGVASEYHWDIARIAKNAVNFPFEIFIPDGSQI